jgi:hypothetical protein
MNPARRARRRTELAAPVCLEGRTLLAFSPLGFSPPDFAISGQAGPRAAWGGVLNVSVFLQNIGATTITEPFSQAPPTQPPITGSPYGSTSQADAPDSVVAVWLSRSPRSLKGAVKLGTIEAPPLIQNNFEQLNGAFTLPSRPPGFAGVGGKFYVFFQANATNQVLELNGANNLSKPVPVKLTSQPLPELRAIALAVPSSLAPGDTIIPQIQIENLGTADPDAQGPVTVDLVASVTRSFTLGSSIVASYTVNSIPAVSQQPTGGNFQTFAQQILSQPDNVVTINGTAVTLPISPKKYFLGIVIDPQGKIKQLSLPRNNFSLIQVVGGPGSESLPPSGVVSAPNDFPFPIAPSGNVIGLVLTPTPTPTSASL